jgi:hypothetical protein
VRNLKCASFGYIEQGAMGISTKTGDKRLCAIQQTNERCKAILCCMMIYKSCLHIGKVNLVAYI